MCLTASSHNQVCAAEGCGLMFGSDEAGDKHRVGSHGIKEGSNRRRCLTIDEMREVKNKKGEPWYTTKSDKAGCEIWIRNRPGREHYRTEMILKSV